MNKREIIKQRNEVVNKLAGHCASLLDSIIEEIKELDNFDISNSGNNSPKVWKFEGYEVARKEIIQILQETIKDIYNHQTQINIKTFQQSAKVYEVKEINQHTL